MSSYSQRPLRHVALLVLGALLVAACGDREGRGPGRTGTGKPAVVAAEGRLDILAWPGFARAGDGQANDAWMRSFEKATACEVHVRRVQRPEQLLAVTDKDGVDLIVAGGETALSLVQSGKVQALDLKRVPAYRGIAPRLAYGAGHVVDGVHYGVPFQWGPLPPAYDQPIRIADAALLIKATRPELRIDDPFALDEAQFAAALAALREQRALVAGPDGTAMESGIAWSDVSMLHAKAKHPNCAMAWMQWSLQARTQALAAASFGSLPVVAAACEQDDAIVADACQAPAFANLAALHFQRTPTARCAKGSCVPYSRWVRDFHSSQ